MCSEQFRLRNFKLAYPDGKDFAVSPWLPLPAVIGYRLLFSLYCLGWVIYSLIADHTWKWFIFLTDCTFLCVTTYFIWSTVISVSYWIHTHHRVTNPGARREHISESRSSSHYATSRHSASEGRESFLEETYSSISEDSVPESPTAAVLSRMSDEDYPQTWYHKVAWLLYTISASNSILITVVFWTLLYTGYQVGEPDIAFHLLNSVFMLVETFLSSIPVRIFHVIYAMLYGILYCLFSVLYWLLGGTNGAGDRFIYPILNYGGKPGVAAGLIVSYGFVGLPMAQLVHFGVFRLRCYLRALRNSFW